MIKPGGYLNLPSFLLFNFHQIPPSILLHLITGISPVSFSAPGSALGVHAGGVCDGAGGEWADMVLSHGPDGDGAGGDES